VVGRVMYRKAVRAGRHGIFDGQRESGKIGHNLRGKRGGLHRVLWRGPIIKNSDTTRLAKRDVGPQILENGGGKIVNGSLTDGGVKELETSRGQKPWFSSIGNREGAALQTWGKYPY